MSQNHRQVLIIDDDKASIERLRDHLQAAGFQIRSADNAQAALDLARQQPPDLIITDLRLPGLNGFQLTNALREDAQLASIPVLWMTAYYDLTEIQAQGRLTQPDLPVPGVLFKPFKQSELQRRVRAALGDTLPTDRPRRILVVDDDTKNLELIERRLEVEEFESQLVETAGAALAALQAGAFDAMLLDLRLPDRDGLDLLPEIHAIAPFLPVIVMTAHGSESIAARALQQGASDYLIKPVGRQELVSTLKNTLEKADLRQENRQAQRDLAALFGALQQSKDALEMQHQRLSNLLEALDLGVLILDSTGQPERINRAGQRLLHLESPNQPPQGRIAELRNEQGEVLEPGALCQDITKPRQAETFQIRWTNGEQGALLLTATPLHDDTGTYRGSILVFQDATDMLAQRQRFDALLRIQEEELHRTDARLRRKMGDDQVADHPLLRSLSHELRMPLHFITSFSSLLASESSPQLSLRQQQMLDRIQHSAERLGQRIDTLIDLSLLGSGLLQPRLEEVVLAPLIQEVAQPFANLAQERGAYIDIQQGAPGLRAWVDPHFCRKILSQLLSNAVKFIGVGGHVRITLSQDATGQTNLEVCDTGIGMSAEQLATLVDPQAGGQYIEGLGLILIRRLAQAMQASLHVESEPGQGSTFRLNCPAPA